MRGDFEFILGRYIDSVSLYAGPVVKRALEEQPDEFKQAVEVAYAMGGPRAARSLLRDCWNSGL